MAGKSMSKTVVIWVASLWTHALFAVPSDLEKSGLCMVDLTQDSRTDRLGEFEQWITMSGTSQEGPWKRPRHYAAVPTKGSSDASFIAWGSVVSTNSGTSSAWEVFPPDWLSKQTNQKEMCGLYHLL